MSVRVICQCGTSYDLKDEFAGKLVKCPQCGRENRAPANPAAAAAVAARAQPDVFDRDLFLLRQQLLRISEKYDVADEQGNKIVFVERPAHLLRNLGALLAGLAAGGITAAVFAGLSGNFDRESGLSALFAFLAVVGFLVVFVVVGVGLGAKRHVTFYRDQTKRQKLLQILQDKKWQPITATYTVRDATGRTLALLWKNYLYNLFRKRWYVKGTNGQTLFVAKEDSIILSLLRRLLGPLFGLLRTNFIILRGESDDVVGEFNRKLTILDRYVLDMRADTGKSLDRRVALALGVMLDTGERR